MIVKKTREICMLASISQKPNSRRTKRKQAKKVIFKGQATNVDILLFS